MIKIKMFSKCAQICFKIIQKLFEFNAGNVFVFAGLHSVRLAVKMATTIKTLVSKKKQRYVEDGYNLDLSYINERVRFLTYSVGSEYRTFE